MLSPFASVVNLALHAQPALLPILAQADPLAGGGAVAPAGDPVASGAAPAASQSGGAWISWVMMLGVFAIFYFLVLRPQQKKANQHKTFLDALQPDSAVVTSGGIYGKVVSIQDQIVTVEIADRVRIRVHKSHVAGSAANAADALAAQQK